MIEPYRGSCVSSGGASKLIHFASHGIAADLRLDGVDNRRRRKWYVLRLAATKDTISGRLISVNRHGQVVELGVLNVSPFSVSSARFLLTQPSARDQESVFLEIRGPEVLMNLPAGGLTEPEKPASRSIRIGAGIVALAGTAVAGGLIAALAFPGASIAAPSQATAGETVRIAYDLTGARTARYVAAAADGAVISTELLSDPHGQITFTVPMDQKNRRVTVRLDVNGMLGSTSRAQSFAVVAPTLGTGAAGARIASFSAQRDPAFGGESVLASYLAVADGGELTVSDSRGRIVARGPFQRHGTTRMKVPREFLGQVLNLQLHVRRGTSLATASVAMPPMSPAVEMPVSTQAAAPRPAPKPTPDEGNAPPESVAMAQDSWTRSGDDPFAVIGSPVGGAPVQVRIKRFEASMRLRLEDEEGLAIDEVAVPPRAMQVALRTPSSGIARTYYLTCSYDSGSGVEVLVRSVRVAPR